MPKLDLLCTTIWGSGVFRGFFGGSGRFLGALEGVGGGVGGVPGGFLVLKTPKNFGYICMLINKPINRLVFVSRMLQTSVSTVYRTENCFFNY